MRQMTINQCTLHLPPDLNCQHRCHSHMQCHCQDEKQAQLHSQHLTQEYNHVTDDEAQEHGPIPSHTNDDLPGEYVDCKA
jgi:hypothetical protein